MKAEDFWSPLEAEASTFNDAAELVSKITEVDAARLFAWRGVTDASWALHSSLYRRVLWADSAGNPPEEKDLLREEQKVITAARRWGLHSGDRGRLSMLEFLATLQHYGAPTRLIDITFNPYVALFFATETGSNDSKDARVFAIEVTGRSVNDHPHPDFSSWESDPDLPWRLDYTNWNVESYVWRPAGFDRRIAAQNGGFLIGGVPKAIPGAWPKNGGRWKIAEVRAATSVAVRPYVIDPSAGRPPKEGAAVYSFRIPAAAKKAIRDVLFRTFSLQHSTIYPDFPGFASSGVPWLPSKPP